MHSCSLPLYAQIPGRNQHVCVCQEGSLVIRPIDAFNLLSTLGAMG